MKVLDVTTGDCHLFEEEELVPYRCGCVVVFTARSPDFSNCVSIVCVCVCMCVCVCVCVYSRTSTSVFQ